MLFRRLISAVISRGAVRRILTASQEATTTSGRRNRSQIAPQQFRLSALAALLRHGLAGFNPLVSRLLLRAFSLHRHNAILVTNRINGTLQYSIGMSAKDSPQRSEDTSEHEQQGTDVDTKKRGETATQGAEKSRLVKYEDHKSGKTLASLREAYDKANKNHDNVWLDFADKSIYVYLYRGGGDPNEALAAFDLDGTLIRPKSNKRIPRSATDWELFSVWTKTRLQGVLRENPARFVIFTNQNGIGLDIVPLEEVQQRIELVTKKLDIPCTVFMATEKDEFRKPGLGMFGLFTECFNDATQISLPDSFYCGDAIGYPSHSDADIKFAQQLCLPFLTPEKFLRGVKPKVVIP